MNLNRREFLASSAATLVMGANDRLRVAVMGVSRSNSGRSPGRGAALAIGLAGIAGAEVAAVCDVDKRHLDAAAADVAAKQARPPAAVADFRRLLDDKSIDALVIGTPDHWHTPAALMALDAGKAVYVEKPCSHNPAEAEKLVAAAKRSGRPVQHGTQRRSWTSHHEAIEAIRQGAIGRVLEAKTYYLFNDRKSIGRGKTMPPPDYLDWALWQGPAPERPYADNIAPYHWHWYWHWGTSELGNNGVHVVDVARWGLGVGLPVQVACVGGRLRYDDDQETPDTAHASFRFADGRLISWEGRSWGGRSPADPAHQVAFYGETGTLTISGSTYAIHDSAGQPVAKGSSPAGDEAHLKNFLDAIRGAATLYAPIEEGARSTLLCLLGNIAWRTGTSLAVDPSTGRLVGGPREAQALWSREYRPGWEPRG
jgi:predicted dehydrogenase